MSGADLSRRRPYRRPELVRVPLRPEEAVLGNCKSSATTGPIQASCTVPVTCSGTGS